MKLPFLAFILEHKKQCEELKSENKKERKDKDKTELYKGEKIKEIKFDSIL